MTAPIPLHAPPDDACLAFVNTRYWRGSAEPTETLNRRQDALDWIAGLSPEGVAATPGTRMVPDEAAFTGLIALRETLFALLAAAAAARPPPPADLAAFNQALQAAAPRQRLVASGDAYALDPGGSSIAELLSPVLWSAADLLAGRRRAHLRQCANPECGWLFLDDSKSHNRRWCAMSACGNRAKARRHHLKHRRAVEPGA